MKKIVGFLMGASLMIAAVMMMGNQDKIEGLSVETSDVQLSTLTKQEQEIKMKEYYQLEKELQRYGVKSATINVYVDVAADQYWREKYGSSWKSKAATVVRQGNTPIKSWFGITYVVDSYREWTATKTDAQQRYDEMKSKLGGTNLLFGFSKGADVGGKADEGGDSAIIFDQSSDYNNMVALAHESGHSYTLTHCTNGCLLNKNPYNYFHNLCLNHTSQWESQKYRH
ncbi:MAG: hypothetical protein ACRCTE_13925 [Cellulosilyticaceae bacterium]